jgi:GNAT superfamily N-acetyltransferase
MATLSKLLTSANSLPHLRQFDARRDIGPVADLIELCFEGTLDRDGRRYLQRLRSLASQPSLLRWAASSADWNSIPFFGYVWEQDGLLVGNASLIPYKLQGKRLYLIANVAVHPDYRRQGIARQLTLQSIQNVKQRQAPAVWLHVREENEAAYQLYYELGFRERARRTTWVCSEAGFAAASMPTDIQIIPARSHHWEMQRHWLLQSYPPEISWYMSFEPEGLNPGFMGGLRRLLGQTFIRQWSALRGKEWLGSIAWQFSAGFQNWLWLSASPQSDERVIRELLWHVRQNTASKRPLALDYPAGQFESAFQSAGFRCHQTLIWMERML